MKPQKLGKIIILGTVLILALMIFFIYELNQQQLESCAAFCNQAGIAHNIGQCPYHQGTTISWLPIISSILVAFIGGIGIYLALSKDTKIIERKEYDLTKLAKEEKEIFELLKNKKEGIYQSEICKELAISKVKMTRILDKLERKGFIERKRRGMTNLVLLK
ncbi:MarR family transcriptional regulator [Candidatus Woesearchaeota archaeon]|nr:MarR family transcriptional regulator [Candidatus Woesearchaeota archaeon]